MQNKIIPSIIAKNQEELTKRLNKISFADYVQLDVMDGKFVKNKSLNFHFQIKKDYELHLMVKNPEIWILENEYLIKRAKALIFHCESSKNLDNIMKIIKNYYKKKVGIALNPATKISSIREYLKNNIDTPKPDKILVMTVKPGKYGSKFMPSNLKKIKEIRNYDKKITIQVDGGINPKTIQLCKEAGANEFVIGSYLQKAKSPTKAIKKFL